MEHLHWGMQNDLFRFHQKFREKMTLGQFWMWGEGLCAEKNSPENPVSILSPKNFSFYLISTGTIITNIISGDERSSFPVVVSYETTTYTCHTWPHHLRVMTSSRGVFETCDRTRPGKQINFTEEGSNDIPWMGDEWLFTFQFEPVYERIFILVRIEYRILFALAKLSKSNSEYYLCCKIYSNNIRIVQNIRIFEYFRIICNAKMKNFPK